MEGVPSGPAWESARRVPIAPAASKAAHVIGFARRRSYLSRHVVRKISPANLGGNSVKNQNRLGGLPRRLGCRREVAVEAAPEADDGVGDAGHLVGEGADGAVVAEPVGQADGPALQPRQRLARRLPGLRGEQGRAGAVDQERAGTGRRAC